MSITTIDPITALLVVDLRARSACVAAVMRRRSPGVATPPPRAVRVASVVRASRDAICGAACGLHEMRSARCAFGCASPCT